jgi:hypothetical protein
MITASTERDVVHTACDENGIAQAALKGKTLLIRTVSTKQPLILTDTSGDLR